MLVLVNECSNNNGIPTNIGTFVGTLKSQKDMKETTEYESTNHHAKLQTEVFLVIIDEYLLKRIQY